MRLFGLTGGVGMGKSTCANLIRSVGLQVIDTDDLARSLTEPGQPAVREIAKEFGGHLVDSSNCLDRRALAQIVFRNSQARSALESILHPKILAAWKDVVDDWKRQGIELGVVVIPLLFETGAESHFNATLCVACSRATQLGRLRQRGWSDEESTNRIAAQLPVEDKIAKSDFVIWSEGDPSVLMPQIERVWRASR